MGKRMKVLVAYDGSAYADAALDDPRRVLAEEARAWAADSIFVGSRGLDSPGERSGLGTVSAALVRNAACSVEVVR